MRLAHDTERALLGAAALVNTGSHGRELLADDAAFERFLADWRWTGRHTAGGAELDGVRDLRGQLRELWQRGPGDVAGVVATVNRMLRDGHALPQLVDHDGFGFHLHATPPDAPLVERMAVEAAMAIVDVVRSGALDRLRTCEAAGCGDVFVDMSKNASRRYCSATCANRVNVASFRARRAR